MQDECHLHVFIYRMISSGCISVFRGKETVKECMTLAFDYSLDFENMDFRNNPELYQVAREQGVIRIIKADESTMRMGLLKKGRLTP